MSKALIRSTLFKLHRLFCRHREVADIVLKTIHFKLFNQCLIMRSSKIYHFTLQAAWWVIRAHMLVVLFQFSQSRSLQAPEVLQLVRLPTTARINKHYNYHTLRL